MEVFIRPLLYIASLVLNLLFWCLLIHIVLGWLVAFGVVNTYNRMVDTVIHTTGRITEPLLRPIRNLLPHMGNVDLSPLVLGLIIIYLQRLIAEIMFRF